MERDGYQGYLGGDTLKNNYEVYEDETVVFLNYNGQTYRTMIDTVDLEKAKEFTGTWYGKRDSKSGSLYVYGKLNNKHIILHRWLTEAPTGMDVDHINHDTLDNRCSCNLRVVSHIKNTQNLLLAKNNKSGFRGVSWNKQRNKWQARAIINKKEYHLGLFIDPLEASEAVKKKWKEVV